MGRNIIYRSASYIWRNTILKWYRDRKQRQEELYWEEHVEKRGKENPEKTFYIIRRRDVYCGLFSLFITNLQRIDDAIKQGYIPVIDMQNNFNIYLSEDKIGQENAWEYYFRQPMGYSLNDIRHSQNVIIGSGKVPEMFPYLDMKFLTGESGELEYWRQQVKKYIVLSEEAVRELDKAYNRLFSDSGKILGVICRGTDYVQGKPKNHPIQPTPEQMLIKAEELKNEYGCRKIFLATEDARICEMFKQHFGDNLLTNKTHYVRYQGGAIGKAEYDEYGSAYESGMEYLITIMLLSKCNCLCAGCVSATVGALLLTEGYEYTYLFDLGIYQ